MREALDRTALIEPLAAQLEDPRDRRRVSHSLPSLLRASVAMIAQGGGDQGDAARLHDDPVLAIAANDRAGVGAAEDVRASQATFSQLLDLLNRERNREALETAPASNLEDQIAGHRHLHVHGQATITVTINYDFMPPLEPTDGVDRGSRLPSIADKTSCPSGKSA